MCSKEDIPYEEDIPCVPIRTSPVSKQDISCVPSRTSHVFQAGHLLCSTQDMSCVQITNIAHTTFERIKPIVPGYNLIRVGCGANPGTIGLTRPKVAFQRVRPTLNGPKIARMAPISTIFGPNRPRRSNLNFEKNLRAVLLVVVVVCRRRCRRRRRRSVNHTFLEQHW